MSKSHTHTDERGFVVQCYHRTLNSWKAWVLAGIIALFAYPIEHFIWERVPPFNTIAEYVGIGIKHEEGK